MWPIYSILNHFSVGSASDEIVTAYAYLAMKPFSHMLIKRGNHFLVWSASDEIVSAQHAFGCPCKNCQNFNAGGACKIVRRRLSVRGNRSRVFSAINEILVTYEYVQPAHAISLENSQKAKIKCSFFQKIKRSRLIWPKWTFKKNLDTSQQNIGSVRMCSVNAKMF
jgi:hypothetical protein